MQHYHTEKPHLCIKATMMGWAVSPECNPEIVEVCSEMIVGDVKFLPDRDGMLEELRSRGVAHGEVDGIREAASSTQSPPT